jgi:hypothetical protein
MRASRTTSGDEGRVSRASPSWKGRICAPPTASGQQIVDTAKSAYGGNLDPAIRSPQIRDLIQLYAMMTGQKPTAMPGNVTPLSLVETGGSIPVNHVPKRHAAAGLGRPSLARPDRRRNAVWRRPRDSTRRSGHNGSVAGEAVNAIVSNPRAVQSAVMNATTSNAGRREMTALQLPWERGRVK